MHSMALFWILTLIGINSTDTEWETPKNRKNAKLCIIVKTKGSEPSGAISMSHTQCHQKSSDIWDKILRDSASKSVEILHVKWNPDSFADFELLFIAFLQKKYEHREF